MNDYSKLQELAEAAEKAFEQLCEAGGDDLAEAWHKADSEFAGAASPAAVLALIDGSEKMRAALKTAEVAMWKAESNMDNEAADIRDLLAALTKEGK